MAFLFLEWAARRRVAAENAAALSDYIARGSPSPSASSLPYTPACCSTDDSPAPAYPIEVIRDVPYHGGNDALHKHRLDIYYSPLAIAHRNGAFDEDASGQKHGIPVVFHVHGGGWQRGDRANEWRGGPNVGRAAARHGFIAVCPSYRLSSPRPLSAAIWSALAAAMLVELASIIGLVDSFLTRWLQLWAVAFLVFLVHRARDRTKVRHPESAIDVCRAVKWVRAHLQEHVSGIDVDVDRMFLSGHSAGGHLVSLVASDPSYFRLVGLDDTSFIRGVCSISGLYSLYQPVHRDPNSIKNRFFRATYGAAAFGDRAALIAASPITHVSSLAPPFLLLSATSDLGLEIDAQAFAARLDEVGVPYEYHTIAKTSHSTIASDLEKNQAHRHLFRFIEQACDAKKTTSRDE